MDCVEGPEVECFIVTSLLAGPVSDANAVALAANLQRCNVQ